MSYKKLVIWQKARELVIDIHKMTLSKLPQFELYEEGSQIRRSIKSVKSNIVEGYGRRRFKQDYLRFLIYSISSCDETTDHLETLYETESLKQRYQLFEKVNKDIKRYPIRTWFSRKLFSLQQFPSNIRLKVVGFFQRGKRGWAVSDTWDFDGYLTEVRIAGMTHLKKHGMGTRRWKKTLQKVISGFTAYKKACNYTK